MYAKQKRGVDGVAVVVDEATLAIPKETSNIQTPPILEFQTEVEP